jgi:hypothetical protein
MRAGAAGRRVAQAGVTVALLFAVLALAGPGARDARAIIIPGFGNGTPWGLKVSARGYLQVAWSYARGTKANCQDWVREYGAQVTDFGTPASGQGFAFIPRTLTGSAVLKGEATRAAFKEEGSSGVAGCPAVCPPGVGAHRAPGARAADCIPAEEPPKPTKYSCPDRAASGFARISGVALRLAEPSVRVVISASAKRDWKNCKAPPLLPSINEKVAVPLLRRLKKGGAVFAEIKPEWTRCPGYPRASVIFRIGFIDCKYRTKALVTIFRTS